MQIGAKLEEITTYKNNYEREIRKLSLYISNNCIFGEMNKPVNKTKKNVCLKYFRIINNNKL